MTSRVSPRAVPQCTACLRSYAISGYGDYFTPVSSLKVQIRGKKKLANTSSTIPVRLLKSIKTFGRRGAIVPIPRGQMRNDWFPRGVADYVTLPELKELRLKNVAMERDFDFSATSLAQTASTTSDAMAPGQKDIPGNIKSMSSEELRRKSGSQKKPEVDRLTVERSMQLLEIFVGPRLEFHRQPIVEDKPVEAPPPEPKKPSRLGGGAAADLLAARTPEKPKEQAKNLPSPIYGSVSTLDILAAVRAAMATNDEAARVVLNEQDVDLVNLPETEGFEAGKIKHIGDFEVEIRVRGSESPVRRIVRVVPQE